VRLLHLDEKEFLEVARCRDRKASTPDRNHGLLIGVRSVARLSVRLAAVITCRWFAGYLVRESAPEPASCGTKRVRVVKGAGSRVWMQARLPRFVHGDRVLGAQITRIALGRRIGCSHDPGARGDPDVERAGYRTGRRSAAGRDALARFIGPKDLDLHARIPLPAFEDAGAGEFFAHPRRDLVAGDDVGDESSYELHVESKRRAVAIDSVVAAAGCRRGRERESESRRESENPQRPIGTACGLLGRGQPFTLR